MVTKHARRSSSTDTTIGFTTTTTRRRRPQNGRIRLHFRLWPRHEYPWGWSRRQLPTTWPGFEGKRLASSILQVLNFEKIHTGSTFKPANRWRHSAAGTVVSLLLTMLDVSHAEGSSRVPHPGRQALDAQPEPVEYTDRHPMQRWTVAAFVEKRMTGKAVGWARECSWRRPKTPCS